jgi:hypothetical protein
MEHWTHRLPAVIGSNYSWFFLRPELHEADEVSWPLAHRDTRHTHFMNGRSTHSTSASLCSSVPCRISYGRISKRGPTSASCTSRCDVLRKT